MKRDPSLFNIDAAVIHTAKMFCDPALHNRPVYGAILIQPATPIKGAYVVAGDGSCVIVQYDPSAVCKKPAVVYVDEMMDSQMRPGRRFVHTPDGKMVVKGDGKDRDYDASAVQCLNHLDYPNWRTLLPKEWKAMQPGFPCPLNADYLSKIANLHIVDRKMAPVHFYTGPTNTSCGPTSVVMFAKNSNLFIIVAPMQTDAPDFMDEEPAWLNPADPAADL